MKKGNIGKIIVYIAFLIIIGKLFSLQIIKRPYYLEKLSSINNKIIYEDPSLRGRILDTNGNVLVDNKLVMTIVYQNEERLSINEEKELAYQISKILELDYSKLTTSYLKDFYLLEHEKDILERLTEEEKENYQRHLMSNNAYYALKKSKVMEDDLKVYQEEDKKAIYLYYLMHNNYDYLEKVIKEKATIEEFMYFTENAHHLKGFRTKFTYERNYHEGDTLKQILGNVGYIPMEKKEYYLERGYALNDKVGLSNLEYVYDNELRGSKALYLLKNNEKILVQEASPGNDIKITIDIHLQKMVDDVLMKEVIKAKKARNTTYYNHSYVLISDTYGGILAISGKEILNGKVYDVAIGNITDTITAGSVVKAASMMVGYEEGAIKIGEVIKDECIKIKATPKKCSVYTMGNINDIKALAYSSNVYQFKTAIRVGKGVYRYNEALKIDEKAFDIYRDYFSQFGLGVKTGIELLNESKGYKGTNRAPGLLLNFAIGQYDTYTNIQLNQYISTIARDGVRYKMHLLKEVLHQQEVIESIKPMILNKIKVEDKYLKRVQEGLLAVTSYGSGRNYVLTDASGKTGTSESFYDSDGDGKIDKETISTNFVMYMPSKNPKVAISINSPNISLPSSGYKYLINQNVIREITSRIEKYLK